MGTKRFGMRLGALIAVTALMASKSPAEQVGLITINGAIGPATASYISRAIDQAAADGDQCLIIQLDTPGGLLDSTKEIVEKLFADAVPTVVYVGPSGANAASAGTFITLAADVAAMAPNTSIGAAHPVSMGGESLETTNDVMREKLENYAASFIETIADKRKHNVQWAKSSVRHSASITAEEALKLKVIDLIAPDIGNLLQQLNGRQAGGKVLRTDGAKTAEIPMLPREVIFQMLWRPEVMFVLMLAAIYGIIGELSNPGAVLPGVAGAIALVLALYMGAILPVNVAGLALMLVALALFVVDIYAHTHGALTAGGLISFFLGSIMLFNRNPAFQLSLWLILPATILTAVFLLFVIGAGLRAQGLPIQAGTEALIGQAATALTAINQNGGKVFADGAYWNAVSQTPIAPGQIAEIAAIDGLTLKVKSKC